MKKFEKLYIATGNPSKVKSFKKLFKWIDPQITIDLVPDFKKVPETGSSLAENSKRKVEVYKNRYDKPVIANDSGLYFEKQVVEMRDPTKIKRNALKGKEEKSLSQKEMGMLMYEYYRKIARKYGGEIKCQMRDVFSLLMPSGGIRQEKSVRKYLLVDRQVEKFDIYFPLNSLRISPQIGKFMDELSEKEEKVDRQPSIMALKEIIT